MDPYRISDATWPPVGCTRIGDFIVRRGAGGGARVSSASWEPAAQGAHDTDGQEADTSQIDAAIVAMRQMSQVPQFQIRPHQRALDRALAARGFAKLDPTRVFSMPLADGQGAPAPLRAFCHWPPLAITQAIWTENGVGPDRQAIMQRAKGPKTAVLGRLDEHPVGAGYFAIHDDIVMIHAVVVEKRARQKGVAHNMIAEGLRWAKTQGARHLLLAVVEDNLPALRLYRKLGLTDCSAYHYRRETAA